MDWRILEVAPEPQGPGLEHMVLNTLITTYGDSSFLKEWFLNISEKGTIYLFTVFSWKQLEQDSKWLQMLFLSGGKV